MSNFIDRLSDLHDPIITHILSFLSTEEAVRTCILSKRWKYLWSSIPVLTFDIEEFLHKKKLHYKTNRYYETKYLQFVVGVLQNRDESLCVDKLYINWCTDANLTYKSQIVGNCFLPALKFKPRVLHASFSNHRFQTFICDLFTCTSLLDVHLRLSREGIMPKLVNLPNLRKLHLEYVIIDDGFISMLFFGCPVLVNLLLSDCYLNASRIVSNQLRELDLHRCYGIEKLQISAPNLLGLKIFGVFPACGISLENFSSPINASLYFKKWCGSDKVPATEYKLLHSLSNATGLDLVMQCPQELLEEEVSHCSVFNNLRNLTLRTKFAPRTFDVIAFFLNHSPNLKKLTLYIKGSFLLCRNYDVKTWEVAMKEMWSQEEPNAVSFQREHLETIEIIRSFKDESVHWLVNYFVAHVKSIGELRVV